MIFRRMTAGTLAGPRSALHNREVLTSHARVRALAGLAAAVAVALAVGTTDTVAAGSPAAPSPAVTNVDSANIIVNSALTGFEPRTVGLNPGGTLTVTNNDFMAHTFTADALNGRGDPLFDVVVPAKTTLPIPVSTLGDGTYYFHCRFHPQMTGTLVIGTGGPVPSFVPTFEQPLVQPPRLHGRHIRIVMRKARVRVLPHGPRTPMWTYGGTFPGPTIVRTAGHGTHVTFVNRLPRSVGAVTVHQHAGHQASSDDGQPTRFLIRHGKSRTYDFPLTDAGQPLPAALRFYHDHRMNHTARNNWFGLQGMFLTTDPHDAKLGLPHGRYDIPLAFTDRSFRADNTLRNPFRHRMSMPMRTSSIPDPSLTPTVGSKVLVNGRYAPYRWVRPGRYRLQILNSSLFSSYDFALSDGRPFVQIGTGSGLLPHPVTRQDILLGPAQRADVVVDFRGESGKGVLLSSIKRSDGSTSGIGTREAALMKFRVHGTTDQVARIPFNLADIRPLHAPQRIAMTWTFGVSKDSHGSYWSINGRRFDPSRVDHRVRLGTTERWKLRNTSDTTHYVHLHEELWRTLQRDGKAPPPWERGYEDTWRLDPGESVVVAAKFTDYTGDFMIHCHMLDHEDDGMMATFRVVK
jgi:spore coat protein A